MAREIFPRCIGGLREGFRACKDALRVVKGPGWFAEFTGGRLEPLREYAGDDVYNLVTGDYRGRPGYTRLTEYVNGQERDGSYNETQVPVTREEWAGGDRFTIGGGTSVVSVVFRDGSLRIIAQVESGRSASAPELTLAVSCGLGEAERLLPPSSEIAEFFQMVEMMRLSPDTLLEGKLSVGVGSDGRVKANWLLSAMEDNPVDGGCERTLVVLDGGGVKLGRWNMQKLDDRRMLQMRPVNIRGETEE